MKKVCLRLLISGAILAVIGFATLSAGFMTGFLDEAPSLSIPVHHSYAAGESIDYGEYSETTFAIDEVTYSDYGYDNAIYIDTGTEEIINKIDIDINMGRFDIIPGEELAIMSSGIDPSTLKYSIDNGCLSVSFDPEFEFKLFDFNFFNDSAEVLITIPEKIYEDIDINIGAGTANILGLTAHNFAFKMSAGEAYVTNVTAYNSSDIKMSAGYSAFADCVFNESNSIKVSAGNMDFSGCLITGQNDINVSAGALTMDLKGSRSYYNVYAQKSAGTLEIPDIDKYKNVNIVVATQYATAAKIPASHSSDSAILGTLNVKVSAGSCYIYFEED